MKVIKVSKMKFKPEAKLPADLDAFREELRTFLFGIFLNILPDLPSREDLKISIYVGSRTTVYNVDFPREQLGRVIGVNGQTISAIRALLRAASCARGLRCVIEIPDNKKRDECA